MGLPLLVPISLLTVFCLPTDGAKLLGEPCEFDGATYAPGESWHPDIYPPGCTTCVCSTRYRVVRCKSRRCPKLDCLDKAVLPGDCCPTCKDNLPPELGPATVPPSRGHCVHNDVIHLHGDRFASTSSGVVARNGNQCTLCTCWVNGDVLCQLKTCPRIDCKQPVNSTDDCCQTCPDDVPPTTLVPLTSTGSRRAVGCRYFRKLYRHGERWHPKIGKPKCIVCQCNNANIDCKKLKCPGRGNLSCNQPCCKLCNRKDSTTTERNECYFVYNISFEHNFTLLIHNPRTMTIDVHLWKRVNYTHANYTMSTVNGAVPPRSAAMGAMRTRRYNRLKKVIVRNVATCKVACSFSFMWRIRRNLEKALTSADSTSCLPTEAPSVDIVRTRPRSHGVSCVRGLC